MPKTYFATGVTSGIGRAWYEKAAADGHRLIVLVRDESRLAALPVPPARAIFADMGNLAALTEALQGFDEPLDGFINFSGVLPGKNYQEYTPALLEQVFHVNTLAPMLILQAIDGSLREGACVVLLGSVSAQKGSYDDGYAASKAAIHGLVRSLSPKLAPTRRIVAIAPGMTAHTRMTDELVEGRFEHNLQTIPLRRASQPQEIAALVDFVLSDACASMTGCTLDINGGQYMR